jgi:hypothetical protein
VIFDKSTCRPLPNKRGDQKENDFDFFEEENKTMELFDSKAEVMMRS